MCPCGHLFFVVRICCAVQRAGLQAGRVAGLARRAVFLSLFGVLFCVIRCWLAAWHRLWSGPSERFRSRSDGTGAV